MSADEQQFQKLEIPRGAIIVLRDVPDGSAQKLLGELEKLYKDSEAVLALQVEPPAQVELLRPEEVPGLRFLCATQALDALEALLEAYEKPDAKLEDFQKAYDLANEALGYEEGDQVLY